MDNYEQFRQSIKLAAERFRDVPKERCIRIVSHLDADGITAASIIINALNRENRCYSISIVQQLNSKTLESLSKEDYSCFIFTDLASEYVDEISEKLSGKDIFILDHHEVSQEKAEKIKGKDNVVFVNPILFGIDGGKEISGAGVVYLFSKELDERNKEYAYLAVMGAIGDVQEDKGFKKLNHEILGDAVALEQLEVREGLRVFGSQTRPLHKILE